MPPDLYEGISIQQLALNEAQHDPGIEIERIEFNPGIRVYIKGHPFPQKGLPTAEAIFAVNQIKRLIRHVVGVFGIFILFVSEKKLIGAFTNLSNKTIGPYLLNPKYMCPAAQETETFFSAITHRNTAKILAHVIEYDQAYRFRIQDLLSETTKEQLLENPRREIQRLIAIYRTREYPQMLRKMRVYLEFLPLALLVPCIRTAFRKGLAAVDFKKLQFDEGDRYWAALKTDYRHEKRNNG